MSKHLGIFLPVNAAPRIDYYNEPLYQSIGKAVDGWTEIVHNSPYLPAPLVMIVNEEGRLRQLPVNQTASVLYGFLIHRQPIVGNVVIMQEVMTDDGPDIRGLDMKSARNLISLLCGFDCEEVTSK